MEPEAREPQDGMDYPVLRSGFTSGQSTLISSGRRLARHLDSGYCRLRLWDHGQVQYALCIAVILIIFASDRKVITWYPSWMILMQDNLNVDRVKFFARYADNDSLL